MPVMFRFPFADMEGRAGMAAITLPEGQRFDSAGVFKHVEQFLPTYARPRFIRIQVRSSFSLCDGSVI